MSPFFSIITVSYNAETLIEGTIRSALAQNCDDFEIIVQDGGSQDSTLSRIPQDLRISVRSEPDRGIYDAMNKAVQRASGRYCIFMNCGDEFAADDVLERLRGRLVQAAEPSILYGDYQMDGVFYRQPDSIGEFYLYRTPLCHQSMAFSRELFSAIGSFDLKYRIMADYDLTLKCFRAGVPFLRSDTLVCSYRGSGVSESKKGIKIKRKERSEIVKRYFSQGRRMKYGFLLALTLRRFRMWLFTGHAPRWFVKAYRSVINVINK